MSNQMRDRLLSFLLRATAALYALAILGLVLLRAQASANIYTFPPQTQPGCTAVFDTSNKLVTTTCTVNGVQFPAISYNPRLLENISGGIFRVTIGPVTISYTHNLPADPLTYAVGSTLPGAGSLAACGAAGANACPTIPW